MLQELKWVFLSLEPLVDRTEDGEEGEVETGKLVKVEAMEERESKREAKVAAVSAGRESEMEAEKKK